MTSQLASRCRLTERETDTTGKMAERASRLEPMWPVWDGTALSSTVQPSALQCPLQSNPMHCPLQSNPMHCTVLSISTQCTALSYPVQPNALHCPLQSNPMHSHADTGPYRCPVVCRRILIVTFQRYLQPQPPPHTHLSLIHI